MKVVIIEDEIAASQNLSLLLKKIDSQIEIIKVLDSVTSSIAFLKSTHDIDLVFIDVHLGDGLAFDIFDTISLKTPLIFTTAYDQYAIKAFKYQSIDYLLKPILIEELSTAIKKFKENKLVANDNLNEIYSILDIMQKENKKFREAILVNKGESLIPINIRDFAFFTIKNGLVKGYTFTNEVYYIDIKLEDLASSINPEHYYRANRQFIIQRSAIKKINYSLNGKLSLLCNPKYNESIMISKAKSREFKEWLT